MFGEWVERADGYWALRFANTAKTQAKDAELMRQAANEIERLRREVDEANSYRRHTERLLALFEAQTPRFDVMAGEEDIAHSLRRRAVGISKAANNPER